VHKRFLIAGGLVLVVAILIAIVMRSTGGDEHPARVVACVNKVDAHPHPKEDWQPAVVDMQIYTGGRVRTGAASSARLELPQAIVRLAADTVFTVKKSVTQGDKLLTTLFLEDGRLWANLTAGQPHEFAVETGNAVAAVRDTRLSVWVTETQTLVSVAEGTVTLTAQEQSVDVVAGQQAVVTQGRPPSSPAPMSDAERGLWATEGGMPELAPPTPTPTPEPTCGQPVSSLVSWWSGDGNAMDFQGGNHGTLKNGATFASGLVGQAFSFDGVNDWVWTPGTNIDGLQQLSIEAWVKLNALPPNRIERFVTLTGEKAVLRYDGPAGPRQLHFYMMIGGRLRHIRVDNVLDTGVFHHVAGTYDGRVMRLYLDGAQVGSRAASGKVGAGSDVELSSSFSETLNGLLDEVGIYDRALSAAEIQGIFDACSAK